MTPGGQASAEATTNAYHDCILARGPDAAARGDAHLLPLRSPRSDQKTDPALGAAPLGWRALMGPSPLGGLTYPSALSKDKRQALAACMRGGARQARGAATQGRLRRVVRRAMRRKLGAEPRTGGCDGRCDGRCCASLECAVRGRLRRTVPRKGGAAAAPQAGRCMQRAVRSERLCDASDGPRHVQAKRRRAHGWAHRSAMGDGLHRANRSHTPMDGERRLARTHGWCEAFSQDIA